MSYRRQKRWWNAYILFYEQVNEAPSTVEDKTIIKTMQELKIGEILSRTCRAVANPLMPTVLYGYMAIKHPVPDRVKPSFVIFDIRAL